MNLATNARDAMAEGGVLRIVVERRDGRSARSIDASASSRAITCVIAFTDTGVGMDEETLPALLRAALHDQGTLQGDRPRSRRCPAPRRGQRGLDRPARSRLGDGTTFEILFPLRGEAVVDELARHQSSIDLEVGDGAARRGRRRLRRLMTRVLTRNGYEVLVAASGEEAVALAASGSTAAIDLLVSDVVMGELSGPELAATLASRETPGLRVVLVSGTSTSRSSSDLAAGSGAFLAKPFRPSELIEPSPRPSPLELVAEFEFGPRLRLETVADAAHGLDPLGVVGVDLDLRAESADVLGHRGFVLPLAARRAQTCLEQLRAGVDLARRRGDEAEQRELLRRELEQFAAECGPRGCSR